MSRSRHDLGSYMDESPENNAEYNAGASMERSGTREAPSLKEIVDEELLLLKLQRRVSVRDLAKKFEKGLVDEAQSSDEPESRGMASLDSGVLLEMLRGLLDSLEGRVTERNKVDAMEAISMVETLRVQTTEREKEIRSEKVEIKRTADLLKQCTEYVIKASDHGKRAARGATEITAEVLQRIGQAVEEKELISRDLRRHFEMQNSDGLMNEVQEARRIIMLHQPSKLCGVRGGGNVAAQAVFWKPKRGDSYILAFESHRQRNAAIMLARRFANACNIMLLGPGDEDTDITC